ncbi:hypothetical protein GCM10010360_54420 [Streptomyces nogalater]
MKSTETAQFHSSSASAWAMSAVNTGSHVPSATRTRSRFRPPRLGVRSGGNGARSAHTARQPTTHRTNEQKIQAN